MKNSKQSTTDPECGLFHKGEHKVEFAYTAHTVCDKHNFVPGAEAAAGNVHDSVMFDSLYKKVTAYFPEVKIVGIDSGYKTPWIMKQIICPNNKFLSYSTTNREGYREYKSDVGDCKSCPCREQCTEIRTCQKVVTRHVLHAIQRIGKAVNVGTC